MGNQARSVLGEVIGWRWLARAAFGIAVGLALGFAIGWWLWPVTYTNTSPAVLRQDYHDDYVLMVATAYEVDGNLARARERLEALDAESPSEPVIELAEQFAESGADKGEVARLARLAWALGATTPTLTPYLEGQS